MKPSKETGYAKCRCGETKTLVQNMIDEQIAAGQLPVGTKSGFPMTIAATDPRQITIIGGTKPALSVIWDACVKCGTLRCVRAIQGEMPWPPPQQAPAPRMIPSLSK